MEMSPQAANPQTYRNDSRKTQRKFSVSPRRPIKDVPSKLFSNTLFTIQEISALVFHGMRSQPNLHPTTHSHASYRKSPDAVCPTKVWRMESVTLLCSRNARFQKDEEGAARCPPCSQNAHDETVVARCAQSRASLGHPLKER